MSEGRGPGEGVRREGEGVGEGQHGDEYKSPMAQREIAQKEAGNPKEEQAEQERISRDEGRYRRLSRRRPWRAGAGERPRTGTVIISIVEIRARFYRIL